MLKCLLGQNGLQEVYTGGIGSYCLLNMIVAHLQVSSMIGDLCRASFVCLSESLNQRFACFAPVPTPTQSLVPPVQYSFGSLLNMVVAHVQFSSVFLKFCRK